MSPSRAIPEERASGIISVTGEPLVWVTSKVGPILISVLSREIYLRQCLSLSGEDGKKLALWLIVPSIWLVALCRSTLRTTTVSDNPCIRLLPLAFGQFPVDRPSGDPYGESRSVSSPI